MPRSSGAAEARGARHPRHSRFGIWESKDGARSWKLLKEAVSEGNGATDIEMDPQNPKILYASFWATRSTKARTAARRGRRS